MRSTSLGPCLVALVAASCGLSPELPGGGGSDGEPNRSESRTNDAGVPAPNLELLAGDRDSPGSVDGAGAAARFNGPMGIATDSAANVYVADTNNNTIRKITAGGSVTTIAGTPQMAGFTPGPLPGLLSAPPGVAISATSLYITMSTLIAVVQNRP